MRQRIVDQSIKTGFSFDEKQLDQLYELITNLLKWNQSYNLTAIKDEQEAIDLHLIDSLLIAPYCKFEHVLDVGTGAGFPGLPLAIALPNTKFVLVDSNNKKTRFIQQMIYQLKLGNVEVENARVEDLQKQQFDAVVSRAFASVADMVEMTRHLLKPDGCWLAMKARYSQQEQDQLPEWVRQEAIYPLDIPGVSTERKLVKLTKINI
ncbi:MAG: 16S rRNA (guanine(527)-N(7))-methyltransferase RsmG [Gammaproteobacteria bacterium]|nr:16S rRNA (guanine(527)-N(7))-methyltransferase RsmG [Gammaproteobacteria bacterium]